MLYPSRIFSAALIAYLLSTAYFTIFPQAINRGVIYLIILGIFLIIFWKAKILRLIIILLFSIILALTRVSVSGTNNNAKWVTDLNESQVTKEVRIVEEPKSTSKSQQIIGQIKGYAGKILITTNQFPEYHFGDTLNVSGKVTREANDQETQTGYFKAQNIYAFMVFPKITKISREYSFSRNWYFMIRKPLILLRLRYQDMISKILPEPEAGLLSGIILGEKANLPTELLSSLSATGTIHIIALSGYNITIIVEFMRVLAKKVSAGLAFWLPILGVIAFVLATGLSASVIRAAIMGIVMLIAKKFGRQSNAFISILFVSSLMVYANPNILVYDVGFQLSFAAVSGILLFAPKIEKYFKAFGDILGPILGATVSAQIFSWPITSYYFGILSLAAPLANLLVLPFVPFVMLIGFITATVGFFSLTLGRIIALFGWVVLAYFIKVISLIGETPLASVNFKIKSAMYLIGYYLILFDMMLVLRRRKIGQTKAA